MAGEIVRDVVCVGASAGGVEALTKLVGALPEDFAATVLIVLHIAPSAPNAITRILARAGTLEVRTPMDGEPLRRGRIYVAPPNRHLVIRHGVAHLDDGPRENRVRPAVDTLFRTAAHSYGPRVVGVVVSGTLDDGTAGLAAIKQQGGFAIVQDPDEALYAGMPRSAFENVDVDRVLSVGAIGAELVALSRGAGVPGETMFNGERGAGQPPEPSPADLAQGRPSTFSCPECHGALWEVQEGPVVRFRCRVGHGYAMESLYDHQGETMEQALYAAFRALKEAAQIARRLAERAKKREHLRSAEHFMAQADLAERRAAVVSSGLHESALADGTSDRAEAPAGDEEASR